jgi:hypothetical protein
MLSMDPEKRYRVEYRDFFSSVTYATWMTLATFLVSFGVVINATVADGEPAAGTAMEVLGIAFVICSSVIFFTKNWNILPRSALYAFLGLAVMFVIISIFLTIRIWVPLSIPNAATAAQTTAPAPAPTCCAPARRPCHCHHRR